MGDRALGGLAGDGSVVGEKNPLSRPAGLFPIGMAPPSR